MTRISLLAALLLLAATASAETFTYEPDPSNLNDLPHASVFTWGIDVSELAGMQVEEVELRITDISNWDDDANVLHLHLLDGAAPGVSVDGDNQDPADAFEGLGPLIDHWVDENGEMNLDTLIYIFSDLGLVETADAYCQDGMIAIGLDPDCHYWNAGITLTIIAEPVTPVAESTWSSLKGLY